MSRGNPSQRPCYVVDFGHDPMHTYDDRDVAIETASRKCDGSNHLRRRVEVRFYPEKGRSYSIYEQRVRPKRDANGEIAPETWDFSR